jgi:protoporphyrinogen oxidase
LNQSVLETPPKPGGPEIAIIGGGIMGIALGYFLARQGVASEVFEASPVVGGLAGPLILPDQTVVDRYYHTILSSDAHVLGVCQQLGLTDLLRFKQTRTGVYVDGGVHSMSSALELLRFRPLSPVGRLRLGMTVAGAQLYRDWKRLESVSVKDWLVALGGRSLFHRLWGPMLASKFDGVEDGVSATWMWARLVRMRSTRDGANQRERAGHLIGGYPTLLSAMVSRIEAAGGAVHLRAPVADVVVDRGRLLGLRVADSLRRFSSVVITMQGPVAARLLSGVDHAFREGLTRLPYLGVVCPIIVLDRPLTGIWTVNIADRSVPFTGLIETTAYIDPAYVGGHHLVYVPKYTAPGSQWFSMGDDEVRRLWTEELVRMFPNFRQAAIRFFMVHRERYVDPLHFVGAAGAPEVRTSVGGLYIATTAQVYPALPSAESVTRHAAMAAALIVEDQAQMQV